MTDLNLQLELALRLVVAAILGALIGLEREYHGHPAGMRTHLLVSVGSATFTVLSIERSRVPVRIRPGSPRRSSRASGSSVRVRSSRTVEPSSA